MEEKKCLLELKNLSVRYGNVKALDQVSFSLSPGLSVGILGESGSGKSTLLKAVAGLLEPPAEADGEILFEGLPLLRGNHNPLPAGRGKQSGRTAPQVQNALQRRMMGNEITMIFQNPDRYLDPVKRIGSQMEEVLLLQGCRSRAEARKKAAELLSALSLPDPESVLRAYPFELSGGMCQRVSIAMASAGSRTKLILADEPTSSLDQIIRSSTADLIARVREQKNAALLLVTHDMRLAKQLSDRIGIMYRGRLTEWGLTDEVLNSPCHPYTRTLLEAVPSPESDFSHFHRYIAEGNPPEHREWISGTHWVLR